MQKDHFVNRANDYDNTSYRLNYIDDMAKAILKYINIDKNMDLLDFGAGTGLLTERIAPYVNKIIAVDISSSMISKLKEKSDSIPCQLEFIQKDISIEPLSSTQVDGVISTMTLHHIEDVSTIFKQLFKLIKPMGFVVFCDIDIEDGTFHTINSGVKHFGFDRQKIASCLKEAGFEQVNCYDATTIHKPQGSYSAFLLCGYRPILD